MNRRTQVAGSPRPDAASLVIPGRQPVQEALKAGRGLRWIVVDRRGGPALDAVVGLARSAGIEVRTATREEMDVLTGDVRHQGIAAVAEPFRFTPLDQLLAADLVMVLDGVTDPRNLGAIARVAEQAGAGGMVIRDRRAAGPSTAAEKAAAGALSWLPVTQVTNITRSLKVLREAGLWTVGLDGEAPSTVWDHPLMDQRLAIVIGEEGKGLSRLVAEEVDAVVSIPMGGRLDSLNASTASAVVAFEWRRRRTQSARA